MCFLEPFLVSGVRLDLFDFCSSVKKTVATKTFSISTLSSTFSGGLWKMELRLFCPDIAPFVFYDQAAKGAILRD